MNLVSVRAIHRRETVYLYQLNTSLADARRLLLVYLARINELAAGVLQFADQQLHHQYHSLRERCRATGAVRHPPSLQRAD